MYVYVHFSDHLSEIINFSKSTCFLYFLLCFKLTFTLSIPLIFTRTSLQRTILSHTQLRQLPQTQKIDAFSY